MINKNSKTVLQFILGAVLFVSIAATGCNNGTSEKSEPKADSTVTEKKMEAAPAVVDTTPKMDTAKTRPIIKTN